MSRRRILGIAGAAMAGTLAVTSTAYANMGWDAGEEEATGKLRFAKETLLSTASATVDGQTYYAVYGGSTGDGELVIRYPMPVPLPINKKASLTVTLDNLRLRTGFSAPSEFGIEAALTGTGRTRGTLVANTSAVNYSGVAALSDEFVITINVGGTAVVGGTEAVGDPDTRHGLFLLFDGLNVHPTEPGSITLTLNYAAEDAIGNEIRRTHTRTLSNVIRVAEVLDVMVSANSPSTSADSEFMRFEHGANTRVDDDDETGGLAANVGKITLGIRAATSTDIRTRTQGGGNITGVSAILGSDTDVTFAGQTDFVGDDGDVYLSGNPQCPATGKTALDDVTGSIGKADRDEVDGNGAYLCIEVDGETEIPETDAYMADFNLTAIANAAFPPTTTPDPKTLGSIVRSGSAAYIPHLTTNRKYNQRIVVVNRSGRPADYTITFTAVDGTTVEAGDDAEGTFPVGRTILQVRDVVELNGGDGIESGGGNTAATLRIEGGSSRFDVATWTTTRADGSTDTLLYEVK